MPANTTGQGSRGSDPVRRSLAIPAFGEEGGLRGFTALGTPGSASKRRPVFVAGRVPDRQAG